MAPASRRGPKKTIVYGGQGRGVAQTGSAHAWGACGRRFKSGRPDQTKIGRLRVRPVDEMVSTDTLLDFLPVGSQRLGSSVSHAGHAFPLPHPMPASVAT